jgi:hypothetical protein
LLLVLQICQLLLGDCRAVDVLCGIDDSLVQPFLEFVATQDNNVQITKHLLEIVRCLLGSKSVPFRRILRKYVTHPAPVVRDIIHDIFLSPAVSLESREKVLMETLEVVFDCQMAEFMVMLLPVVRANGNLDSIWNQVVDEVLHRFAPGSELSVVEKLGFVPPSGPFSQAVFSLLLELKFRLGENVSRRTELFRFLVDNLLYCSTHFIEIGASFSELLTSLANPELRDYLVAQAKVAFSRCPAEGSQFQLSRNVTFRGLRNMGATCYLNSILQQLFWILPFRDGFLSQDFGDCDWAVELQNLFGELRFFPAACVDPSGFVGCWKGIDDMPISPRTQQDAVEFLNLILDRMEQLLPDIVKPLFYGTTLVRFRGVGNDFEQETKEPFLTLPLQVMNLANVSESFEASLVPEDYPDYQADGFGKIPVVRTTRILESPPFLIITLQRFTYVISAGERTKINSKYEFPEVLDIAPITTDPSQSLVYDLIGIVQHFGTAQAGHYVSHVKIDGDWRTFNDGTVSKSLDPVASSFGGHDGGNAYLLFYSRRDRPEFPKVSLNSRVIENCQKDVERAVLKSRHSNSDYLKLITDLCDDSVFLFELLGKDFPSWLHKKCECPAFAAGLLSNFDRHERILLQPGILTMRSDYVQLIVTALRNVNKAELETFSDFLFERAISLEFKFFPTEFFSLFLTIIDLDQSIELATWLERFSCILKQVLHHETLAKSDISILFRIMLKLLPMDASLANQLKQFLSPETIKACLALRVNSVDFTQLLSFTVRNSQTDVKFLLSVVDSEVSAAVLACVFVCVLPRDSASVGRFCETLAKRHRPFLQEFLGEVARSSLSEIVKPFFEESDRWVRLFVLNSDQKVRDAVVRLFQLFPQPPLECFIQLHRALMAQLPSLLRITCPLLSSYESIAIKLASSPTFDYFCLLQWTITNGGIVVESIDVFLDCLASFRDNCEFPETNFAKNHCLSCLFGVAHSFDLFDERRLLSLLSHLAEISFADRSKLESIKIVQAFLPLIPPTKVQLLFNSELFDHILKRCFSAVPGFPVFSRFASDIISFILDARHRIDQGRLRSQVFGDNFLYNISEYRSRLYLKLCRSLIKRDRQSSIDFRTNGCHAVLWRTIASNTRFGLDALKTLAVFNRQYSEAVGDSKNFWKVGYAESLSRFWAQEEALTAHEVDEPEAYQFCASLGFLSKNFQQQLWTRILDGRFLGRASFQKDYAKALVIVYSQLAKSAIVPVAELLASLGSEFKKLVQRLKDPEVVLLLAKAWVCMGGEGGSFVGEFDRYLSQTQFLRVYNRPLIESMGIERFRECKSWSVNVQKLIVAEYRRPSADTRELIGAALSFLVFLRKEKAVDKPRLPLGRADIDALVEMNPDEEGATRELFT